MDYEILFDVGFDEYEWDVEEKGCLDLSIKVNDLIISISFYHSVRLVQEIGFDIARRGFFFERNVIVLPDVNRANIEQAVEQLNKSGILRDLQSPG